MIAKGRRTLETQDGPPAASKPTRARRPRRDEAELTGGPVSSGAIIHARPAVTVDIVVFTVIDADLKVLLIRRGAAPFAGAWALPGGFVRAGDPGDGDDQ